MKQRFEALDAFRGLCALSVVVFHIHLIGSFTELDFFKGSAIFVEFFFVLSGFVLAHGYGFKENLNAYTFMKARFFRLYPLHLCMFMFFFIFQFVKLFAHKVGITFYAGPFTGQTAVSEIIPNLLLLQSWLPFADHASFNGPSWSISIEFYMYALLFLTIVGFRKYKVLSWFGISLLALLLMYCKSEVILSAVLRGLSCFFGGAFTYTVYKKVSHYQPRFIIGSFIEVLLIFFVIYVVQSNIEHRSIIAPVLFFITVLFFAFESGIVSTLFKLNPLQQMGKLSYSIYMVHAGILYCVGILAILIEKFIGVEARVKIADVTYLTFGDEVVNNIVFAFILLLVIYVSNLTYKYIEIPGQALNKR